jgi:hypothetical protein
LRTMVLITSDGHPQRPMQRHAAAVRALLLCLGVALLSACSSTTFVYNRLDFLLPWYLERYVDLESDQSQRLDARLEPLLAWHRRDELPRYIELIVQVEATLDEPLSRERVAGLADDFEEAWYRLRDRGLEELLLMGASLSDRQIEEFLAKLQKKQEKYQRKYLDRDDVTYADDAFDNLRETLEDYLGRLDRAQRDRLLVAAGTLQRSDRLWLSERAAGIAMLTGELRREPGWQGRIRDALGGWEQQLDAGTVAIYEHNSMRVQEAIAEVVNTRSDRQNQRLRRRLAELREDLLQLSTARDSAGS